MGLSTTASFGIIFTASLFMLGVLLNSLIYSYANVNQGMEDRVEIIQGSKNIIKIEKIVYNSSQIEIIAWNQGPITLDMSKLSILINGSISSFISSGNYWYPGQRKRFFISSAYSIGNNHDIQFAMDSGARIKASAELDKIYILISNALEVYSFEGDKLWSIGVNSPLDVAVDSYIFVLNSSEILEYDLNGNYVRSFGNGLSIVGIAAYNNHLYAVSSTSFYIFDYNGTQIKSVAITDGKDVAVGSYVYVLRGNTVEKDDYDGNYVSSFSDSRLTNASRIAADRNLGDTFFVLNNQGEILVYRGNAYLETIALPEECNNIDVYGKIYLSGTGLHAMNLGYRVKLVDEYGNTIYDYL